MSIKLSDLIAIVRRQPPMSKWEREEQRRDFTYGNLACTTNHRQTREMIDLVADSMLTPEECIEFAAWRAERATTKKK